MPEKHDNIGLRILNSRLVRKIGQGGMAAVYEGQHASLKSRRVAVKILDPLLARRENMAERFLNEAEILAGLAHPRIVQVLDFVEQDGLMAIVMPYLEGMPLSRLLERDGAFPPERAARFFAEVLEAFAHAHRKGVAHRDVKPSNIMVLEDGSPVVLDFGIAKLAGQGAEMTATGAQMGTPIYMSPEQIHDSKRVDHRSDIYSLGVTLHHLLSGVPPYDTRTSSNFAIFTKIVNEPLPRLPARVPGYFQAAIDRATAKDPEGRFHDCRAFSLALAGSPSQPESVVDVPPRPAPAPQPDLPTLLDWPPSPQPEEPTPDIEPSDWSAAESRRDMDGYRAYLQKHPWGRNAQQARAELERMARPLQLRWLFLVAAALLLLAFWVLATVF